MKGRKRLLKKLIQALREPAPLSNNKGPVIHDPKSRYLSHKDKKQSGWVTPRWNKGGGMKYQDAVKECLEPQEFYDEWKDYRDGLRDRYGDASHFKRVPDRYYDYVWWRDKEWMMKRHINKKLLKEMRIRRAAKLKRMNTTS